jgi:hypothetical protein
MAESKAPSVAGRWFGLRAEYEAAGRWKSTWYVVRELCLGFLTAGLFLGEFDPKRRCAVFVFRRDTGRVVAQFDFSHLAEASTHVSALANRLADLQVYDFCRQIGVSPDEVHGAGIDADPRAEAVWVAVRSVTFARP